jgi:hypothetical protein
MLKIRIYLFQGLAYVGNDASLYIDLLVYVIHYFSCTLSIYRKLFKWKLIE